MVYGMKVHAVGRLHGAFVPPPGVLRSGRVAECRRVADSQEWCRFLGVMRERSSASAIIILETLLVSIRFNIRTRSRNGLRVFRVVLSYSLCHHDGQGHERLEIETTLGLKTEIPY